MNGKYYYDPGTVHHTPIESVWGIPADIFVGSILFLIMGIVIVASTWDWWAGKIYLWRSTRQRKKRLKSGKGRIKSFIINVAGNELTQNKIICITNDINTILGGKILKGVKADPSSPLDSNNVVGITDVPGVNNHFFVIWYKEV